MREISKKEWKNSLKHHGLNQLVAFATAKMVSCSVNFLPICDTWFNLISAGSYICDITLHVIVA